MAQLFKARPTIYRGVQMRSRMEAEVAASLDEHGIPWLYEPHAFASPEGQYLPDFLIYPDSSQRSYLEVKGVADVGDLWLPMDRFNILFASEPNVVGVIEARGPTGNLRLMGFYDQRCGLGHWYPAASQEESIGAALCQGHCRGGDA